VRYLEAKDWYKRRDIIRNIDWKKSQNTDIMTFNMHYCLTDSHIMNIISEGYEDLILVISLDNELLKEVDGQEVKNPILFLFFLTVKKYEVDYEIDSGMPFEIGTMKSSEFKDNEFIETLVSSDFGRAMKILHKKELKVLLFDENENIVKLSKL
jgi:hypothetical protein